MIRNTKILTGLHHSRYEHPFDKKALETLGYEKRYKFFKFVSIVDSSHPWTVMRAAELVKWIESGSFIRIINSQ